MKIAFIHSHRSFLPELAAYKSFFQLHGIETCILKVDEENKTDADVYWYMMGFFPKSIHKKKLVIHEYASASVPPYRKMKDFMKSKLNPRPHFRIFLNEYVRQQINIHDEIPFGFRDMGISDLFFQKNQPDNKEYDFIYSGNTSYQRKLDKLLRVFVSGSLKEKSILLLGNNEYKLSENFSQCKNIFFKSAVPWHEVPDYLSKARFAINFIPDEEPYNAQTPTKFLEYAAMHLPIISTNYFWISEFSERYGGNYYLLKEDLSNLSWDKIIRFNYAFPELRSWRWDERIKSAGILEFLQLAGDSFKYR